jgi:HSP20 family molecular chaperone IbpA
MGNFYWMNFDSIWNHFDQVLNNWETAVVEPKKQLACLPNYPHSDCWVDDTGDHLWLRFALAGYSKDSISVNATQNVLRVTAKGDKEEGVKFVHHGISKKDVDFALNIDEAFNLKEAKTDFLNGLLTIKIPRHHKGEHATVKLL